MVAIRSKQREAILEAVKAMYSDVAAHPERTFHFPTGRDACLFVGYPEEVLVGLPFTAVESFAGVGFPFAADGIRHRETVLDVGSGAGTDVLIASGIVGREGTVFGLDMTRAMLDKLEHNAALAKACNVEPLEGNAEQIPLPRASVDVVTSNGVLNLVPDKPRAVREIFRVLHPGGSVQIADIVLRNPASEACREHPELWAECIVGATLERAYLEMFRSAGFADVEVIQRHDYFAGSASPQTRSLADSLGGHAIVMRAFKPE
jgi:SAM-dependent methyltransferase